MLTFLFDFERLIHSLKTAFACMIGFVVIRLFNLPGSQWVVLTIIIVMCGQVSVGGLLQKAYFRFLGTLTGCLIAALTIYFIGDSFLIAIITIGFSSFIFSYIATAKESLIYTGTLGATTTAIIMLMPNPNIELALERFFEISIGILIATLVSQFIFPVHARSHLLGAQAVTLKQLREFYISLVVNRHEKKSLVAEHEMDEAISKTFLKQRQLAKESLQEPLGIIFNPKSFMTTLYYEKEILRSINFMHLALMGNKKVDDFVASSTFHTFNQTILQAFNMIINSLETNNYFATKNVTTNSNQFKKELLQKIDEKFTEDTIPLAGFLFSADMLIVSLEKLAEIYNR